MNILHAATDPMLLQRLRQMLGSPVRADIAVGYPFVSGFNAVADGLAASDVARIGGGAAGTGDVRPLAGRGRGW